ncbi:hypothetical protein LguiA_012927 [Lonicera macranthoides]
MAQICFRALTPNLHPSISLPRLPQLPIPFPSQDLGKETRHRARSITSALKLPSALLLDATTTTLEDEIIFEDKEENVSSAAWKYPFTDIEVKKKRELFGGGREWSARDVVKFGVGVVMHALCLLAPFTFTWSAFAVMMTLVLFTGFGITLSFHRNLAHRSFKLPKWLEYFWAYCGSHALQGSPLSWVSIHRTHHLHADKERDPHSPIEGFWFSHFNWMFDTKYYIDKQGGALNNVGDMDKQPFYWFMEDTYLAHPIALAALLYAVGGLPWLVWGMGVRSIVLAHSTYLVASGLHIWGSRTYNTDDNSHNNWFMAFLTLGEGWHNNHHAFEYSARQGLEWYEVDFTWYLIKLLDVFGLVKDIKLPTEAQKKKMLERWN